MDVQLTLGEKQTIIYPQATGAEDRGGVVRGFIELDCRHDVKIEAFRLRLVCLVNTVIDGEQALKTKGGAGGFVARPTTLFIREATFIDLQSKQPIEAPSVQSAKKGKTVLPFQVTVPSTSPGTQHHLFHKVSYELISFVRGKAAKGLFSLPFTYAPIQPVFINVHPSSTGVRGVNPMQLPLRPTSHNYGIQAKVSCDNARFGGCFHLNTYWNLDENGEASVVVQDVNVRLEQCFIVRGKRVEGTTMTTTIADSSNILKRLVEIRTMANSSGTSTPNPNGHSSQDKSGLPSYEDSETRSRAVQRIEIYNHFPSGGKTIAEKDDMIGPLREWQASTPVNTQDDLRVEHMLYYTVTYLDKAKKSHTAPFITPLYLVKEDMRSDAVQLPQYSASPDALDQDGLPLGLPPPPEIDALT